MRQITLSLDQHRLQRQAKGAIQICGSFSMRSNRASHRRVKTQGPLSLVNPQLTGRIPSNQQSTCQWITTWSSYKKGLPGSKIKSIQTTWIITTVVLWARDRDYQKTTNHLRHQSPLLKRKTKRTFKSASDRLEQACLWTNPMLASLICTPLAKIESTELTVTVPHSTTTLAKRCHQEPATFSLWAQWRQYLFKSTRTKTPTTIWWLALQTINNRCQ